MQGPKIAIANERRQQDRRQAGIHGGVRVHLTAEHQQTQQLRTKHEETIEVILSFIPKEIEAQVESAITMRVKEFLRSRMNWNHST